MKRIIKKWTKEEDNLLKEAWITYSKNELLKEFGRSMNAINKRAISLGLSSSFLRCRNNRIENIMTNSEESFYWWGFIIADGSIDKNYTLKVSCDIKDRIHLEKLAKLIQVGIIIREGINFFNGNKKETVLLTASNKYLLKPFKEDILKWFGQKTYNPIEITHFNNKNLIYFLIGLIDGDGCIYLTKLWNGNNQFKNCRIVLHGNWYTFLEILSNNIKEKYNISSRVSIDGRGNSVLYFKNSECEKLEQFIGKTSYLERKWEKLRQLS